MVHVVTNQMMEGSPEVVQSQVAGVDRVLKVQRKTSDTTIILQQVQPLVTNQQYPQQFATHLQ